MTILTRSRSFLSSASLLLSLLYTVLLVFPYCTFFSVPNEPNTHFPFDRFRVSCPADVVACVQQYDSSLTVTNEEDEMWAAVYRSNNNLPTVLLKDDF
jgi:hypothetical protein